MRFSALWVLAVGVSISPAVARADTVIDDFVLTGNGQTILFSLPSIVYTASSPVVASATLTTLGTVNGVSNISITGTFFTPALPIVSGLQLFENGSPVGTATNGLLNGPDVLNFALSVPPGPGGQVPLMFLPGKYTEASPPNSFYPGYQPFTLTITPEASSVPEPAGLILTGTGCVCLFALLASGRIRGRLSIAE